MSRALLVLALLGALLSALVAVLPEDGRAARAPRIVRARDLARSPEAVVAGLSLEYPQHRTRFVYARSRGRWRCLSAFGAPCDDERVVELVQRILGSSGSVRARADAHTDELYGFLAADAVELVLHGKDLLADASGDELLRLRFGAPSRVAGAQAGDAPGAFARVQGSDELVELGFEPRALLGPYTPGGFPPLLDTRVIPLEFPPAGTSIQHVLLEREDGRSFELVRRAREPLPPGPGVDPAHTLAWEWILAEGGTQTVIPPMRGEAWVTYVTRAPYVGLEDPRQAGAHGIETPRTRLTLSPSSGEALQLAFGDATDPGGAWISNRRASLLVTVDATTLWMLLPERDELVDAERENRWDTWLRERIRGP